VFSVAGTGVSSFSRSTATKFKKTSSTWRSDNGFQLYIVTISRLISGELLK
jgi:hypothetical protein